MTYIHLNVKQKGSTRDHVWKVSGQGFSALSHGSRRSLLRSLPMAALKAGPFLLFSHTAPRLLPCRRLVCSSMHSEAPPPLKIIGIGGSIRRASAHQGLIRAAIEISKELPGLEIEALPISQLPFVNTDLEENGRYPDVVEKFREKILQADGILFAAPEYNFSVTGVLKNAIDWASRPPNVWADKPAAIVSGGGAMGGSRSQYHLRQIGVFVDLHFINKPELCVRLFEPPTKVDNDGNLVHEDTRKRLKELIIALQKWTLRIQNK